jgi:hypothetical protein
VIDKIKNQTMSKSLACPEVDQATFETFEDLTYIIDDGKAWKSSLPW